MDILDADEEPLYSMKYRRNMESDIVQFVPYRDFRNNPAQLARETLDEIPRQMLDFFRKNDIQPLPSTEEQKRKLQQKLSMQRSLGGDPNLRRDDFFSRRKEAFLEKMMEHHGLDLMQVKDFLDDKCVYEENQDLVLDLLTNPLYVNPLKQNFQQPTNPHAVLAGGYDYVPNMVGQQPMQPHFMPPQRQPGQMP